MVGFSVCPEDQLFFLTQLRRNTPAAREQPADSPLGVLLGETLQVKQDHQGCPLLGEGWTDKTI